MSITYENVEGKLKVSEEKTFEKAYTQQEIEEGINSGLAIIATATAKVEKFRALFAKAQEVGVIPGGEVAPAPAE